MKKKMNCPIHRVRQLSENLYCVDCGKGWRKDALKFFWDEYEELKAERDLAQTEAEHEFNEAVARILGSTIERYGWK